jgi:hypothetical protein
MRMIMTAGLLCAVLLLAVTSAVHAKSNNVLECPVSPPEALVGE